MTAPKVMAAMASTDLAAQDDAKAIMAFATSEHTFILHGAKAAADALPHLT